MISATAATTAARYRNRLFRSVSQPASSPNPTMAAGVLTTPITIAAQPATACRSMVTQMMPTVTSVAVSTSAL